ncbi:hypothetical protein D3C83_23500 [compost metagenome]
MQRSFRFASRVRRRLSIHAEPEVQGPKAFQCASPVFLLRRSLGSAKPLGLPLRQLAMTHRGAFDAATCIQPCDLRDGQTYGPAVAHQMVGYDQERVLFCIQPIQDGADQGTGAHVEALPFVELGLREETRLGGVSHRQRHLDLVQNAL